MSELKAWTAQEIANSEKNFLMPPIKVYLKSEADKVIAEKDKTIAELKDKCQMHDFFWEGCGFKKLGFKNSINVRDYCDELKRQNEDLIPKCRKANKELRHQKYKRCLAMARWCESNNISLYSVVENDLWKYTSNYWLRWRNKWLELAEKFKEADDV